MNEQPVLRFTSRVLGQSATKALLSKAITLTMRSEEATLISFKAEPRPPLRERVTQSLRLS